ncbi:methyl-accepting chemotaxis protein [Clostridium sp. A1-XYC3]|uniref:Methyl-accepting chemotaxis protein n=1 Tax=Clostridium tanneri TaxID=3037988 RepID=A0ABU4JRY6_9CLOT|nr:methyl-accepting chemotaxis protein [Clostridium sp. A1-XYC3]MDW8800895.1 methyl-accepting chemotaxis protein [Clostridium sp. A1-XYC3]
MRRLKIRGKLFLMITFVLAILSISILTVTFYQVNILTKNNLDKQLNSNSKLALTLMDKVNSGYWRIDGDKLYKGQYLVNDNHEFVDKIKEDTGDEITIFLNDTRISTTIINSGKRATGTKASAEVVDKVLNKGEEYVGTTNILNTPYEVKYVPIKDREGKNIGMFFLGVEKSKINEQVVKLMSMIGLITLTVVFFAFLFVVKVTKSITDPLHSAVSYFGIISKGDLSVEVSKEYVKRNDEIGDLSRAAQRMHQSFMQMIIDVKNLSENINNKSKDLNSISEEMSVISENVSKEISTVADFTEEQAEDLTSITTVLNRFGENLDEMVQAIKEIDVTAKDVNYMANKSNNKLETLIQSITEISGSFKEFSVKINILVKDIDKIDEITKVINDIADQTNLLALNAAIEAARAGEAGRGFAVVAQEIRNLADQSKISSEDINKLIDGISNETEKILYNTKGMSEELNNEILIIKENIDSFKTIIQAVDGITPRIEAVNMSALNISGEKNTILEKIETSSAISEETAASSREIAAASREMSSSSNEVADTAGELLDMTKDMMDKVNKFKM